MRILIPCIDLHDLRQTRAHAARSGLARGYCARKTKKAAPSGDRRFILFFFFFRRRFVPGRTDKQNCKYDPKPQKRQEQGCQ